MARRRSVLRPGARAAAGIEAKLIELRAARAAAK
jgi:hypothetical protein